MKPIPPSELRRADPAIGTLTVNNALTNLLEFDPWVDNPGSVLTKDGIKGASTLAYGGTLQLVLSAGQFAVSNSFNFRNDLEHQQSRVNGTLAVSLGAGKFGQGSGGEQLCASWSKHHAGLGERAAKFRRQFALPGGLSVAD